VKMLLLTAVVRKVSGDCLKPFETAETRAMTGISEKHAESAQKVISKAIKNLS